MNIYELMSQEIGLNKLIICNENTYILYTYQLQIIHKTISIQFYYFSPFTIIVIKIESLLNKSLKGIQSGKK